jgi:hypothetical protein
MDRLMFFRVERRARRMKEMMRRLDVDTTAITRFGRGDPYRNARNRCLFCGTSDKCLRWLDQDTLFQTRPAFCPNLSLFESCKRRSGEHVGEAANVAAPPQEPRPEVVRGLSGSG